MFILQLSVCFTFRISGCRKPTLVAALVQMLDVAVGVGVGGVLAVLLIVIIVVVGSISLFLLFKKKHRYVACNLLEKSNYV